MFKTGCIFIFFTYKDKNVHSYKVRGEKVKLFGEKKDKERSERKRERRERERMRKGNKGEKEKRK